MLQRWNSRVLLTSLICLFEYGYAALPDGDDCLTAVPIAVPADGTAGHFQFNNVGASNSSADSICTPYTSDVWFSTQPVSGLVRVSTCRSWGGDTNVGTVLAAYTACGGVPLACNGVGCNSFQSTMTLTLESPTVVYIRIAGRHNRRNPVTEGTGTFTVIVTACQTCGSIPGACGSVHDSVCNRNLSCGTCEPGSSTGGSGTTVDVGTGSVLPTTGSSFPAGGVWSAPFPGPTLFGHQGVMDPATGRLWIHGGFGVGVQTKIYAYNNASMTFDDVTTVGDGPGVYNHAALYAAGRVFVHGGAVLVEGVAASQAGFQYLDVASSTWHDVGLHGPDRYGHTLVMSATADKVIMFGGIQTQGIPFAPGMQLDILEFLDPVSLQWTSSAEANVTGFPPTPRYYHSTVVTKDNMMVIYGGVAFAGISDNQPDASQVVLTDVWQFDIDSLDWGVAQPIVSGTPPGTFGHCAVYSRARHAMMIFGGLQLTPSGFEYRNWIHLLDIASWTWTKLDGTQGTPPSPRYLMPGFLVGSSLMVQGGVGRGGMQSNGFWLDFEPVRGRGPAANATSTTAAAGLSTTASVASASTVSGSQDHLETGNGGKSAASTDDTALSIGLGVGLGVGGLVVVVVALLIWGLVFRGSYRFGHGHGHPMDLPSGPSGKNLSLVSAGPAAGGAPTINPVVLVSLDAESAALQSQFPPQYIIDYASLAVEAQLGAGAFGVVYKARWHGSPCVVKQSIIADTQARKLFYKEALAMTRLHPFHPNVVQLVGVCVNPEHPLAIVLEWVDGGSLDNLLKDASVVVTEQMAIELCRDISAGMLYLHLHDVVHCDLSARNVLLSPRKDSYVAKIADFGLSHVVASDAGGVYTAEGPLKVPIRWTAPEILEHPTQHSKAADVWSYGVVMWEILERDVPYSELSENAQVILAVSRGHRLKLPTKVEHSPQLDDLLLACFRANPGDRPTMTEIHNLLQSIAVLPEASAEASDDSAVGSPGDSAADLGSLPNHESNYQSGANLSTTPPQSHHYDATPMASVSLPAVPTTSHVGAGSPPTPSTSVD